MSDRPAWRPHPVQEKFLRSSCFEILFGGQAGGGKSASLLTGAARFVDRASYRALILRRTGPELDAADGIVESSVPLYLGLGGTYGAQKRTWRFPLGARVSFGSCENEMDRFNYKGWQVQYLGFDELTSFIEVQYIFLVSRLRTPDLGVPCFVRATSNPGGVGHDWVLRRWRWWLYRPGVREDEHPGPYAKPGEVLWILRDPTTGEERPVAPRTPGALTRTFIPARLADNPVLAATEYGDRLNLLDPLTRRQLAEGDWMARAQPGTLFSRAWLEVLDDPPTAPIARVRYWDRAAADARSRSGDWTAGVRMALLPGGRVVVEDVVYARLDPGGVLELIRQTAARDFVEVRLREQVLEVDPGQAGLVELALYRRELGTPVDGVPAIAVRGLLPRGSKVDRFKPFSAAAAPPTRRAAIVFGPWNAAYLDELEQFPTGRHDDQADATSGAYADLSRQVRAVVGVTGSARPGAKQLGGGY